MKWISFRPIDFLKSCVALVIAYAILFQIMARTHMMEKVMASTFSWRELLLIVAFLVSRLLTYLLVPAVLAALAVFTGAQWGVRWWRRLP